MIGELLLGTVVLIVLIVFAISRLSTNTAQYFEDRNLKYAGVTVALRNIFGMFSGGNDFLELALRMYNVFPDQPYVFVFIAEIRL